MKKITLLYFLSMLFITIAHAGNAMITFKTSVPTSVIIYKPISGYYNTMGKFKSATIELSLSPDSCTHYSIPIEKQAIVFCKFSGERGYNLYLFPGSQIKVNIDDQRRVYTEGDNSKGINFINDMYIYKKYQEFHNKDSILIASTKDSTLNINQTIEALKNFKYCSISNDVQLLEDSAFISHTMADMMRKENQLFMNGNIISNLTKLKEKRIAYSKGDEIVIQKFAINSIDSLRINQVIDSIYKVVPVTENLLIYSDNFNYINKYARHLEDQMSKVQRKELLGKYTPDTFGPYTHYLLLPPKVRVCFFAQAFMTQITYKNEEFDRKKMYQYMCNEFPNDIFTAIVGETFKVVAEPISSYIINDTIRTLHELSQQEQLKGKLLFVDMWATWCIPCRAEFQHAPQLYEMLSNNNINLLYLSFDDVRNKKTWQKITEGLSGFHMIASEKLMSEIKRKVYNNNHYSIPRYILLDTEGNILDIDLPRPSDKTNLKSRIEKYSIRKNNE